MTRNITQTVGIWLQQIRAPFLTLSIALVLIGTTAAQHGGYVNWLSTALLLLGVTTAHVAVNLFNELSDDATKIDAHTKRTPFSGGSGMLQAHLTTARQVSRAAHLSLGLAGLIGLYFVVRVGWPIAVIMLLGGIAVRFYTSHLSRWLLGEFFSGLTLGSLVVLGVYFSLTGYLTTPIILLSVPPGLLTALLLLLNEIPDAEADRQGGRFHLVIWLGKKRSAYLYGGGLLLCYAWIAVLAFVTHHFLHLWLALLPLPLAIYNLRLALTSYDTKRFQRAQALNVLIVLSTDLLLAAGIWT